jgi:hypothetical protein
MDFSIGTTKQICSKNDPEIRIWTCRNIHGLNADPGKEGNPSQELSEVSRENKSSFKGRRNA